MGKGLFDYIEEHKGEPVPDAVAADVEAMQREARNRIKRAEDAARLKASILEQLRGGNQPQQVLYTALRCIGFLDNDPDFSKEATGYLDAVYSDLAQQSFVVDNVAEALARLREQRQAYRNKARTAAERLSKNIATISRDLNGLLLDLDNWELSEAQEAEGAGADQAQGNR